MFRLVQILLLLSLLPWVTEAVAQHRTDSVPYEREADYFYLQALSLQREEKYDAAYDLLEHCRNLQPSSSSVLFELANMYQYLGQRDKALKILREIVENNPKDYHFWLALLRFFDNEGNQEALLKIYEEMARIFPEKGEVQMALAAQYVEQGDYVSAIKHLDEYEKQEGDTQTVQFFKYKIYVMLRDKEAALATINAMLAASPDDADIRSLLAETYLMFDEKERALAVYGEVLNTDPDNAPSLAAMSKYYKEQKNDTLYVLYTERLLVNERCPSEERKEFLKELVLYKRSKNETGYIISLIDKLTDSPHCFDDASAVFFSCINIFPEEKVRPLIKKILSLEPDNESALLTQLFYAIEREDNNDVLSCSDAAIMYHPEMLVFYYYRGLACLQLGLTQEAIDTYLRCLEKCKETAPIGQISEVYTLLGDTYHNIGNIDATMCAYDSALVYNSSNIVALNNYAYYLALEGRDLHRALEMSERTLLDEPDEPIYIDTYAWILFLLERYDEAKEYADKLLQREGEKSAVEYHHCGDIYAKSGDIEKAVECWSLARDKGDDSKKLKKKIKKRKYIK